jgi:hypothetical protein
MDISSQQLKIIFSKALDCFTIVSKTKPGFSMQFLQITDRPLKESFLKQRGGALGMEKKRSSR